MLGNKDLHSLRPHTIENTQILGWEPTVERWAKNGSLWRILFLQLLITSASTCLKNSRNLGTTF